MTLTYHSQCIECKHCRAPMVCVAFPEGIPEEIIDNQLDHRYPIEGDNGVRWEKDVNGSRHPMKRPKKPLAVQQLTINNEPYASYPYSSSKST